MIIKTITYIERKNLGNFEFAELTSTAELKEGEDEVGAVEKLMAFVQASLTKEVKAIEQAPVVDEGRIPKKNDHAIDSLRYVMNDAHLPTVVEAPAVVEEAPVKEKKTRVKKEKKEEEVTTPEEPKGKNVTVYNSNIAEHKSIFGGYLAKKYDNAWKTVAPTEEIRAFTATLNGKHFLDNDGNIVDSFLGLVHGFFGA